MGLAQKDVRHSSVLDNGYLGGRRTDGAKMGLTATLEMCGSGVNPELPPVSLF
jgi:hypothetical protein